MKIIGVLSKCFWQFWIHTCFNIYQYMPLRSYSNQCGYHLPYVFHRCQNKLHFECQKIKNTIKSNTTPTVLVLLCHKMPKQKYFYYVVIYGNLLSTYCLKHLFSISVSWHFVLLQFSDAKSPFDFSNDALSILIQSEIIKRRVLCDIFDIL